MIFIFFLSFLVYLGRPVSVSEVIFVPQGSTLGIISYLSEKNTDANKIDAVILRAMGHVQAGWIDLGAAKLSKLGMSPEGSGGEVPLVGSWVQKHAIYYIFCTC